MARIKLVPEGFDDFGRFFDHMAEFGAATDASQRVNEIIEAVDILAHSPLIGRKVRGGSRELVIGGSSHGYVALYRFLPDIDTVLVLAFRSEPEAPAQDLGARIRARFAALGDVRLTVEPRQPARVPPDVADPGATSQSAVRTAKSARR